MVDLSRLSEDEKIFAAHVSDLAKCCEKRYSPQFTLFLDERQAVVAQQVLAREGLQDYLFYGGFDGAVRKMLGIFPSYSEYSEKDFPLLPLTLTFRREDKLSHRDFLGALMALQIKREAVGDILIEEGRAVIFLSKTVSLLVKSELHKVGSTGVKISDSPPESLPGPGQFQELFGTVSSLRLDCIVSFVTKLSREKAAQLIRSGLVSLDYMLCQQVDRSVKEGDRLSIRGFGKYILGGSGGLSKKGRIRITVKKYS